MKKILITRKLINSSEELAKKFFEVKLNKEDKILSKEELIRMKLSEAGRAGALKANKNRDYPIEYIPSRKGEYDKTLCEDKKAY